MKSTKSIIILLLIVSNAFFIAIYAKKQDEVNATKIIAEMAREEALESAKMAEKAAIAARASEASALQAVANAHQEVDSLMKQLEDCKD